MTKVGVLFVCMGNICRSPTAEGVFRKLVAERGLLERFSIDSAGTIGYHSGSPPDRRAQFAARARGYDLSSQRARQVSPEDCKVFDYILAMDGDNLNWLKRSCTASASVQLLLTYAPELGRQDVPDPYYGGDSGFEQVLDLLEIACQKLLDNIVQQHKLQL